jgi:hypothetical protein
MFICNDQEIIVRMGEDNLRIFINATYSKEIQFNNFKIQNKVDGF